MPTGKEILKGLVLRTCSPGVQKELRRWYVVRDVLRASKHEEPEAALLPSLIRSGDSVADIGANVGYYTRQLASLVGRDGRVYSFEPLAENFEILETVVRKGHLENVRCFRTALGSQPGLRELVIPNMKGFTGTYWAHFAHPGDSGRREPVKVLSLDTLWKKRAIPQLDFIKCDVERAELEVLEGGRDLIRSRHAGWLLEVSQKTSGDVFSLFHAEGYHAFVYAGKLAPTEQYREGEFSNYFFLHPESVLWRRILPSS